MKAFLQQGRTPTVRLAHRMLQPQDRVQDVLTLVDGQCSAPCMVTEPRLSTFSLATPQTCEGDFGSRAVSGTHWESLRGGDSHYGTRS